MQARVRICFKDLVNLQRMICHLLLRRYHHVMSTIPRLLRLPTELARHADQFADRIGLSFNDLAIAALSRYLKLSNDRSIEMLTDLSNWVTVQYGNRFPENVTQLVFAHIKSDSVLNRRYKTEIRNQNGADDRLKRAHLHRKIGLMVKRTLNAKVVGRLGPLDPDVHLIRSCAKLRRQ